MRKPAPLTLCGHQLPWVESAVHLGHELHESGLMDHDAVVKRAQFIDSSVEMRSLFDWAAPTDVLKALNCTVQHYMTACCGTWEGTRPLRCMVHGTQPSS